MKNFRKLLFFAFALLLCVASLLGGTMLLKDETQAEIMAPSKTATSALSYQAFSREASHPNLDSIDSGDYSGSTFKTYNWKDIESIKFNLGDISNTSPYEYSLKVEYYQKYKEQTPAFDVDESSETVRAPKTTIENVYFGNATTIDDLKEKISEMEYFFDCHEDDKDIENANNKTHKNYGMGWGMYRFTLTVNRTTVDYVYAVIVPSKPLALPNIAKRTSSSTSSLDNAYTFYITNEEYKYVDANTIKWFVKGETVDNVKYVLTQADLSIEGVDATEYIYQTIDREGTSFYLDFRRLKGNWKVYCEVYDAFDKTQPMFTSEELDVTSSPKTQASIWIWVGIGIGGALLLGIIIIVIVKSVKKEKVY